MHDAVAHAAPPAGQLAGEHVGGALVFRGVPYARAQRFQAPEPFAPWHGVCDARSCGPQCPQAPDPLAFFTGSPRAVPASSEDCQVLTIATPGLHGRRPVMVWLHGGAYLHGSGELACYSPERLAVEGDVVVVCVSYRLGAFGFLAVDGGASNCGTLDQRAALQWVQRNISALGGDPDNITAFGQSAGGHAVLTLMTLYAHERLFHRAILQSAPLGVHQTAQDHLQVAARFRLALRQDPYRASAEDIVAAQATIRPTTRRPLPFSPAFPPTAASAAPAVDLMVGWARDDAAPFLAMARGARFPIPPSLPGLGDGLLGWLMTRQVFSADAIALAVSRTSLPQKTYVYRLDMAFEGNRLGAGHGIDLPLLLGNEAAWAGAPLTGRAPWSEVDARGRNLRAAWAAFAHSGNPETAAGPAWKPFDGKKPRFVRLR